MAAVTPAASNLRGYGCGHCARHRIPARKAMKIQAAEALHGE